MENLSNSNVGNFRSGISVLPQNEDKSKPGISINPKQDKAKPGISINPKQGDQAKPGISINPKTGA